MGGVDGDCLADIGEEFERVVVEGEVADEGVVEELGSAAVLANVVGGPAGSEVVAAHGEFADEVGEVPVVGVASGVGGSAFMG